MKIYHYPKWLKVLYPGSVWGFSDLEQKVLYLTFDDGPSDTSTNWVLNELDRNDATATFFCLGNEVIKYPKLFEKIIAKGHSIGNHSMTHVEGLKSSTNAYINDVLEAKKCIDSNLFRPPYGSLKFTQHKKLKKNGFQTVFWSFVTYDYAEDISVDEVFYKMKKKAEIW